MVAANAIAIGIGLRSSHDTAWSPAGALLDADFEHRRYLYGGQSYRTEASFLAAVGGVRAGATVTIGPTVIGPELLVNGSFDTDVSGWVRAVSPPGDADPVWLAPGRLQVTTNQAFNRFGRDVAVTNGKAYRFGTRPGQNWSGGSASVILGASNLAASPGGVSAPFTSGQLYLGYSAATAATMYLGAATSGAVPRTEQWDDFTVREAVPVGGHNYLALSGCIAGTTPAAASGNKVLFQADDAATLSGVASEQNRLRLVWDASAHLRLVVTRNNSEQVNLDLGVVNAATAFAVRFSATANEFKANLDGGAIGKDSSGQMPAIAAYRIGRSNTGEAWDGTIERVSLFPATMADATMIDPSKAFAVYGDSTAHGDGGTAGARWWELLAAGYAPDRTTYNAGSTGQSSSAMSAGLLADTAHRRWTTIIMDLPNTGEAAANIVAAYKAAVANLRTNRWLIVPPVDDSPEAGGGGSNAAIITTVQQALLNDPFFTGHSFDAAAQATYLGELVDDTMRSDGIHFNNAGQEVQAAHIRDWLDARGW